MAQPAYNVPVSSDAERGWPVQGTWTYEDYLRLPDDGRRYEIIRGMLYVSAAPTFDHQFVAARLSRLLGNFVDARDLGVVLFAPFDVNLPALTSPVQPDILFIRSENLPRPGDKNFAGVPDLVVEILSPGTSQLDRDVKYSAYEEAGVQEYWLIEPITCEVQVYQQVRGARGFVEAGRFGPGQTVRSVLLDGFAVAVNQLFPQPRS